MAKKPESKKNQLQINLHFGDNKISACGMLNGVVTTIIACDLKRLFRKIRKHIKLETLTLTFQPEE